MTSDTPIFVSEWGTASGTMLTGVEYNDFHECVVLNTAMVDQKTWDSIYDNYDTKDKLDDRY